MSPRDEKTLIAKPIAREDCPTLSNISLGVLSKREIVEPEPELTPDIINRLKEKIKNQK